MRLRRAARRGLSLVEVIVSLAIFLFSLIALGQMLNYAGSLASEARARGTAARLAQSKLAELTAGAAPLQGGTGTCEDEPDYEWRVEAQQSSPDILYNVTVTVSRTDGDGNVTSVALSQMVLDPKRVGNLNDYAQAIQAAQAAQAQAQSQSGAGGASSGGSTSSGGGAAGGGSSGGGAAGGGGGMPAGGGAAGGGAAAGGGGTRGGAPGGTRGGN